MLESELFTIAETKTTPEIRFDLSWGILDIRGLSIPEYPGQFYQPLIDSILLYNQKQRETSTINFSLKYYNSSSARSILTILNTFLANNNSSKIVVNWYYNQMDDDLLETVKDLEELSGLKFKYLQV
jgi:hypothetical protein